MVGIYMPSLQIPNTTKNKQTEKNLTPNRRLICQKRCMIMKVHFQYKEDSDFLDNPDGRNIPLRSCIIKKC